MTRLIADGSMFAGSNSLIVYLPFLFIFMGLGFIVWALRDRVDAKPPDGKTVALPDPRDRPPLYRLHQQIRASAKKAEAKAEDDTPRRHRTTTSNGSKLVVHR
jgi:hypothetical protein